MTRLSPILGLAIFALLYQTNLTDIQPPCDSASNQRAYFSPKGFRFHERFDTDRNETEHD